MEVLTVDQHPGGAGKTNGMSDLSEVVKAGGETDRMDAPSEIGDAGSKTDLTNVLSEAPDPGGSRETDGRDEVLDASLVVAFDMQKDFKPKPSVGESSFLARVCGWSVFFECWKTVGYGGCESRT